jgi:hypothetical protein
VPEQLGQLQQVLVQEGQEQQGQGQVQEAQKQEHQMQRLGVPMGQQVAQLLVQQQEELELLVQQEPQEGQELLALVQLAAPPWLL